MGIFDKLKKGKEKEEIPAQNSQPYMADLQLYYSSGTKADVMFDGEEILGPDFENKRVQNVRVVYTKANGEFEGKHFYVEPVYGTDQNGQPLNCTKQYYQSLLAQGRQNDVKGFFKQEVVADLERTNGDYLGNLQYDTEGQAFRETDDRFREKYAMSFNEKKRQKEAEAKHRNSSELARKLAESINSPSEVYQNMLANEDARARGDYNLDRQNNVR